MGLSGAELREYANIDLNRLQKQWAVEREGSQKEMEAARDLSE